jgi:hypothetical protein
MSEQPFSPCEVYTIMFAAGVDRMPILGCSHAMVRAGLGSGEEGLTDIVPREEWSSVDDWIFSEVQSLDEKGEQASPPIDSLRLTFPNFKDKVFAIKAAWLEFPPMESEDEDSIQLLLKVQGLEESRPQQVVRLRRSKAATRKHRKGALIFTSPSLAPVQEEDEDDESSLETLVAELEDSDLRSVLIA